MLLATVSSPSPARCSFMGRKVPGAAGGFALSGRLASGESTSWTLPIVSRSPSPSAATITDCTAAGRCGAADGREGGVGFVIVGDRGLYD